MQVQISGPEIRENEDELPLEEREALERRRVVIVAYIRTLEASCLSCASTCMISKLFLVYMYVYDKQVASRVHVRV